MDDEGNGAKGRTIDAATVEADLIRTAERERLRALVAVDIEVARELHADDFQLITPAGITRTKEQYLGAIAAGDLRYRVFELVSEINVRLYGEAAVIRYQSNLETETPTGKRPLTRCWHTDSYERRDGRWQVVWSQATRVQ